MTHIRIGYVSMPIKLQLIQEGWGDGFLKINLKPNLQEVFSSMQLLFPMLNAYLIFVIFFTQAKILDRKIYTEERVNYGKRILRQNSVNCDLLAQATYTNYTLSVKLHTVCKTTYWV